MAPSSGSRNIAPNHPDASADPSLRPRTPADHTRCTGRYHNCGTTATHPPATPHSDAAPTNTHGAYLSPRSSTPQRSPVVWGASHFPRVQCHNISLASWDHVDVPVTRHHLNAPLCIFEPRHAVPHD